MTNLLASLIVAFWISAIALISVQNAAPVSLKFLTFQSVQVPVGLVVAFSAALGTVGTALILPLGGKANRRTQRQDFEDDIES